MNLIAPALAALLLAAPASAATAPPFHVAKVLNAPVSKLDGIGDLKGKVVYLEFWATWCPPCVAGIPRVNRLIEALKDEPVVFLSVTDEPAETIESFLKTHEMKGWVGIDVEGSSLKAFDVSGRPQGFLIGKDGRLLAKIWPDLLREKDLRDAVAGTFKEQPIEKDAPPARARLDDDFPGKTLIDVRVSVGGEPKKRMRSAGAARAEAWGLPFRAAAAHALDVQFDQVIVDSAPVPSFNFRLSAPESEAARGREMLKTAIESAFHVTIVREIKTSDALTLVLSKTPGAARPKAASAGVETGILAMGGGQVLGTISMADAAKALWMNLGKPVLDETGLAGDYEFDLQWKDGDDADRDRALAAAGLGLVPARRPVEFYRVVTAR